MVDASVIGEQSVAVRRGLNEWGRRLLTAVEARTAGHGGISASSRATQAVSFERLAWLIAEVFDLSISEGAIGNILARAQTPLVAAADTIAAAVRASPVVGPDETSARVGGKTWWHWVLLSSTAICHVIADSRAASVVTKFLRGAHSEVWVVDRCGRQLGRGGLRQICLAYLLRDTTYVLKAGDTAFASAFKLVLLPGEAILGSSPRTKRWATLKDSTLAQYHAELGRRPGKLLSRPEPKQNGGRRLFRAMRRDRASLIRFVTRRDVPYTNNACERALRPSVIFRKVPTASALSGGRRSTPRRRPA